MKKSGGTLRKVPPLFVRMSWPLFCRFRLGQAGFPQRLVQGGVGEDEVLHLLARPALGGHDRGQGDEMRDVVADGRQARELAVRPDRLDEAAGGGVRLGDGVGGQGEARITSYNVCYTKLLRAGRIHVGYQYFCRLCQ